ncbi:site-specific DNA-methyltransferase [Priestia megaterium]|uniref:DNA-methyltransferase n=1 Tax=Priestia megaterium TaxID=1404 RepID=UPI0035CB4D69
METKKTSFFEALSINEDTLKEFSKKVKVSVKKLRYYNDHNIFPSHEDFNKIKNIIDISELELKLKMGILDYTILQCISNHADEVSKLIANEYKEKKDSKQNKSYTLSFETERGKMFQGDCLELMEDIEKESLDLIFADPPFNLDKKYESGMNDKISEQEYLRWTEEWVLKCISLLKEGGSFFVWNLPKWNIHTAQILNKYLHFRHWIAVDIKYTLPIKNKLYPAHYSLLYYTKGDRPNTFNEQRLPLEVCRHCAGDIHDYGGYKHKLNPLGINISDVWDDISPVRHSKYKTRGSNELSLKLLERVLSIASKEGDTVFDPFGGSGTTYIAAEILKRNWIGIELGNTDNIKLRFEDLDWQRQYIKDIQANTNVLFTEKMKRKRINKGHWTPETLNQNKRVIKKKDNKSQTTLDL